MLWLILGVILWSAAHLARRVAPGLRARLGAGGKWLLGALALLGLLLMVFGYKTAAFIPVYAPPRFLLHLNSLLMLLAVLLLVVGHAPGLLRTKIRHPMLNAVKTWAIAHLLVRGDLASIILFGGLFAWALFAMIRINRAEPDWTPPAAGPLRNDLIFALLAVAVFGLIVLVHGWIGPSPFGAY